jgi:multiple sugar transport system ATP-binding protein
MNLLPTDAARRSADDGALDAALAAAVPDEARRVGVRPEDLYLVDDAGSVVGPDGPGTAAAVHDCEVTVVEPIGRAYELTLSTASGPVVVRARTVPDELRGEPRIGVTYDRDALYAFDDEGGRIR